MEDVGLASEFFPRESATFRVRLHLMEVSVLFPMRRKLVDLIKLFPNFKFEDEEPTLSGKYLIAHKMNIK